MQLRTLQAIALGGHTDELINTSYIKILTEEAIESIKLPTAVKNYRLQHLLRPNYLLEVELVKTRKNWILTNIHSHKEYCRLTDYTQHLKFADLIGLLNRYSWEGQEVNILDFLVKTFHHQDLDELDLQHFEFRLLQRLGFVPQLTEANLPLQLHWAKSGSGLV